MNFKALSVLAVGVTSAIISTSIADAQQAQQASKAYRVNADHSSLITAVKSTGIMFKVNPSECWDEDSFGWYWARKNEMVICQENKQSVGVEATWTAEDLDTLRHEAQHLIQDCMDGSRQGKLDAVYSTPLSLAKDILGSAKMEAIREAYSEESDHIQVMELEAFSVAAMDDAAEQVGDVKTYCF